MKLRKAEKWAIAVTALVLALTLGFHLGTAHSAPELTVRTESRALRASDAETDAEDTVDLNRAGVEELKTLRGIGDVLAERIVEYRASHGPFQRVEDLTRVKGIGRVVLEENRSRLTIGEETP